MRKYLRSKIHHARITHADIAYEGSITLSPELLEAAGFAEFEAVHVWNVTSGTRLETYTIRGEPGSRDICINGAAAHLVKPSDMVIIAAFTWLTDAEAQGHQPRVVFLDEGNNIKSRDHEIPGPKLRKN